MIAYVDSSVVLRFILNQPGLLASWDQIDAGIVNALVEVECLRTLDRVRLLQGLGDEEVALRSEYLRRLLASMDVVEPTRALLSRASQPFPTSLGTLDAIHLATALLWRDNSGQDLILATHDAALAIAGRAVGLSVIGV